MEVRSHLKVQSTPGRLPYSPLQKGLAWSVPQICKSPQTEARTWVFFELPALVTGGSKQEMRHFPGLVSVPEAQRKPLVDTRFSFPKQWEGYLESKSIYINKYLKKRTDHFL